MRGTISKISSYYGIITFDENRKNENEAYTVNRSVPFFSSDISQYGVGDEVDFLIDYPSSSDSENTLLVRGQPVQFATNITIINHGKAEPIDNSLDFYQLLNLKITPCPELHDEISVLDYLKRNNLRYSTFNEILVLCNLIEEQITITNLQDIINYDKKFKEFIMKWVLFVEDNIKARIENRIAELCISEVDLFDKAISSDNKTLKKLLKNSLKSLRKNYLLRDSGDIRLPYEATTDEIPKLEFAPIDMLLDQFTVGDLLVFIKFINDEYSAFKDDVNTDWEKTSDFLSELKLVRNISAHGNSFLSAILDEKNNPNYLLEETHIFLE